MHYLLSRLDRFTNNALYTIRIAIKVPELTANVRIDSSSGSAVHSKDEVLVSLVADGCSRKRFAIQEGLE